MKLDSAEGKRLNTILNKKVFKDHTVNSDEVKAVTGLTIRELILCWLFDPRNDFQKALNEWRENGEPMNYEEIQGY